MAAVVAGAAEGGGGHRTGPGVRVGPHKQVGQGGRAEDGGHKVLVGSPLLVVLDDLVEGVEPLLVVGLEMGQHGAFGPGGVDGRGPDQPRQGLLVDDDLVEEGAEIGNIWFAGYLKDQNCIFVGQTAAVSRESTEIL